MLLRRNLEASSVSGLEIGIEHYRLEILNAYKSSSCQCRCLEPLLSRLGNQTGAFIRLCEMKMLPFNPSNELLPSESIVHVLGECFISCFAYHLTVSFQVKKNP